MAQHYPMTKATGGLVYGRSKVSWSIRFLTQFSGERPTLFNHAFVLRRDGTGGESLMKGGAVELPDWRAKYDKDKYWGIVFGIERGHYDYAAAEEALDKYIGTRYDGWAIAKCAADGLLSKLLCRDVFMVRRVRLKFWKRQERWHICSWLWTYVHKHGGHRVCGADLLPLPMERVTPDDIGDDATLHRPSVYCILAEFGTRPPWLAKHFPALVTRLAGL